MLKPKMESLNFETGIGSQTLPPEVVQRIFTELSETDLDNCSKVNTKWAKAVDSLALIRASQTRLRTSKEGPVDNQHRGDGDIRVEEPDDESDVFPDELPDEEDVASDNEEEEGDEDDEEAVVIEIEDEEESYDSGEEDEDADSEDSDDYEDSDSGGEDSE